MATLVGIDSGTSEGHSGAPSGSYNYTTAGDTAIASGTATVASVYAIASSANATHLKIAVYDENLDLVASGEVHSPETDSWVDATLSSSVTVVSGKKYYLAICGDDAYGRCGSIGAEYRTSGSSAGTYADPPAHIAPTTDGETNLRPQMIHLDGTVAGGGVSIPKLMHYYQQMRSQ
jgi:hypothetical protein